MKKLTFIVSAVIVLVSFYIFTGNGGRGALVGGEFGTKGCTASSTAWTIGPQASTTVLGVKGNRAFFALTNNNGTTTVAVRLDTGGSDTFLNNGIYIAASSTFIQDESIPYHGAVSAKGVLTSSSTLTVTECIYN